MMSDEAFHASNVSEIIYWADNIASQWDGDDSGNEDRATQAREIVNVAGELRELILAMEEL